MNGPSQNPTPPGYASASDMSWSKPEKTLARRAFDAALSRELQEVMQEAKRLASKINQPSDLWELEHYLTQHRKDIDRKYAFRSSHLTQGLGRLVYENRVSEAELRGLRQDKLKSIRSFAEFLKESAA
jgi:hypothetical protein